MDWEEKRTEKPQLIRPPLPKPDEKEIAGLCQLQQNVSALADALARLADMAFDRETANALRELSEAVAVEDAKLLKCLEKLGKTPLPTVPFVLARNYCAALYSVRRNVSVMLRGLVREECPCEKSVKEKLHFVATELNFFALACR